MKRLTRISAVLFVLIIITAAICSCNGSENSAPAADAGSDQKVKIGSMVTLDGSGSSDADGDTLTYLWSLSSVPAGSAASLSGTTSVAPTFTADVEGLFELNLVVDDGAVSSAADTVTITASLLIGVLDTSFGTDGVVFYDSGNDDAGYSVAIQSDGKALVAGHCNWDLALWRYNTDGTLDTTYGTGGVASYDGGDSDEGYSVAIQTDGKALVTGYRQWGQQGLCSMEIQYKRYSGHGLWNRRYGQL